MSHSLVRLVQVTIVVVVAVGFVVVVVILMRQHYSFTIVALHWRSHTHAKHTRTHIQKFLEFNKKKYIYIFHTIITLGNCC